MKEYAICMLQAHALVLDMPASLCAEQAVGRQQHEGGVQGEEAARISHSVAARLRREGPPSRAEGLSSVIVSSLPADCLCLKHSHCIQGG